MKSLLLPVLVAGALSGAVSAQSKDIVTTAVDAGSFSTLAAALGEAGLVDALRGDGPFTVFAPTDAAFAKLDSHVVQDLLKPENRERLKAILTFHVVPGRLEAKDVLARRFLTTLQGQRAAVRASDGGAAIAGAAIVQTDIQCSNGVIHVIDSVLLPAQADLVGTAKAAGFSTLLAAAKAAGLAETLATGGPFTVFAPTDEAFAALPKGTLEELLKPQSKDRLAAILKYHVVEGRVYSDAAASAGRARTLGGAPLSIGIEDGRLTVGGASVIANDVDASNGVVHVIDRVLLPPAPAQPAGRLVIGVYFEKPSAALASQLGIDRDQARVIDRVVGGSEAEKAGLERYDVLIGVNGMPFTDSNLKKAKESAGSGGTLHLELLRAAKRMKLDCKVGVDRH